MKQNTLIICAMALAFVAETDIRAIPPPTYNPNGNRTPSSICPATDGSSHLDPVDVVLLPPPGAGDTVITTLGNGRFPGWTFTSGPALNGTLVINYYWSKFVGTHHSGARIDAVYTRGAGDPATLRWVQVVTTTSPLDGSSTRTYIDQDPDSVGSPLIPFYYAEEKSKKMTAIEFKDQSSRKHPPTSSAKWQGSFYLASWDGAKGVTVHDGIMWGWMGGCENEDVTTVTLTTIKDQDSAVLVWQTNSPGTNLPAWRPQSTTNAGNPSSWTDRTNEIINVTNHLFRLVVPRAQPQEFFRLALDTTPLIPGPVGAYVAVSPNSNTVAQSHEAFMFVRADGTLPITYQWLLNGAPILNATNGILDFPQVQFTNQGFYTVTVSNAYGTDLSDPALLQVVPDNTPPTLVSVAASSNRLQVIVTFSEPVAPAVALNTANYQVQSINPPGLVPFVSATQGIDQSIVILNSSAPLGANSLFFLQASPNITDLATPPNHLPPGSQTTFNTGP